MSRQLLLAALLVALATSAHGKPCSSYDYYMDFLGECFFISISNPGTGYCDTRCHKALANITADGCLEAVKQDAAASGRTDIVNVALQKCNSPTTDDCVEEVEHMVIADCLNADTSTGYCPQSCKAAIALSPLNKDARCREVVASYLNDLGENYNKFAQMCGATPVGAGAAARAGAAVLVTALVTSALALFA